VLACLLTYVNKDETLLQFKAHSTQINMFIVTRVTVNSAYVTSESGLNAWNYGTI